MNFEFIRNRGKVLEDKPCLKVLGNSASVQNLASMWVNQAEDFSILLAHLLHEYATSEEFTKEEYAAYKMGLMDVMQFLEDCKEETYGSKKDVDFT
jgi:hypothetical protein